MADADFGDPVTAGVMLADAGSRIIQLRAKGWSAADIRAAAQALLPALHARGALLIINDHPEIAAQTGADGVHVGQDDGALAEARAVLGPDRILGLSTHTPEQVQAAQGLADYIGFGPVFGTRTKATGYAPRGIDALHAAAKASAVPVVAIGGIDRENVGLVQASGAHCWAIIRGILGDTSPSSAARWFVRTEEKPSATGPLLV